MAALFPLRQSLVSASIVGRCCTDALAVGTNYINSNLSWQIPLILQAYSCLFVMTLVFFIPESPRYLMANGKDDQAFDFLVKYHGNGDRDAPLVRLEMAEWREQISQTGADKKWWDCESDRLWLSRSVVTLQIVHCSTSRPTVGGHCRSS